MLILFVYFSYQGPISENYKASMGTSKHEHSKTEFSKLPNLVRLGDIPRPSSTQSEDSESNNNWKVKFNSLMSRRVSCELMLCNDPGKSFSCLLYA
jgi:hypothetical protein